MSSESTDVTLLLQRYSRGDHNALDELIPLVYNELRRLASSYLQGERIDHTLQTTALVHEAYIRLVNQRLAKWNNRNHFFAVAAQMMRRILVDHARKHSSVKRGRSFSKVPFENAAAFFRENPHQVIAVDELLTRLTHLDPQATRMVELRFFAGLSLGETADVLGISVAKVRREWTVTRAWLARELNTLNSRADERTSDPS